MSRRFIPCLAALVLSAASSSPAHSVNLTPASRDTTPASTTAVWPEVRRETKPWTRWWWLGNIADEKSITVAMESYAAAGLGGLELASIYGVRGYEDRFIPYLSPRWNQLFEYTVAEARRLDLGLDFANGTGWPFGGPWLTEQDAAHTVAPKTFHVAAGQTLAEPVTFTPRGLVNFAGPTQVPLAELKHPVTANPNLQELALNQVRFAHPAKLVTLIAYPAASLSPSLSPSPLDLTAHVRPDGHLDWTAPADAGDWTLYALFESPHGKMVERAAPGGEGLALDHFSSTALHNYLAPFSASLPVLHSPDEKRPAIRAFFNDSYEVDDAEGEANWTPRFLAEFQQRRGYDLRHHLPALFAGDDTRVLSDYRETVSDLLLDEFTIPWREWAHARGSLIRNQAHNAPASLLDLYAASDIPEQEGNGPLAMKLASSAAHLTGKPLASAEIATWLNEHFLTTLAELKANADTFLLAGLNHLFYHGTALSPADDPWPGFQFYASVELNPANPFWSDFRALNTYLTRAQSFLQSGTPDEDILLYHNIHDTWAQRGDGHLPHFGHGSVNPVGVSAATLAAELQRAGIGFDYISDRLLQNISVTRDDPTADNVPATLHSAHARYRAILIPEVTFIPEATFAKLVTLAEQGATILVHRALPKNPAGFRSDRAAFAQRLETIRRHARPAANAPDIVTAQLGDGRVLIGENLSALLAQSDTAGEPMKQLGLDYLRRRTDDGFIYFVVNRSTAPINTWIPFSRPAAHAILFDPMTGAIGAAGTRLSEGTSLLANDAHATPPANTRLPQIHLQLAPGESLIVRTYHDPAAAPAAPSWPYTRPAAAPLALTGEWSVTFNRGGPTLPSPTKITALTSWTEFNHPERDALRAFSGTATYTLTFSRPSTHAAAWQLDLGTLHDSARVILNGRELATLIQPPWRVMIPADALTAHNTLEIAVTNLAANRIADLDRHHVPWKKFYNVNMPAHRRENTGPDRLFTAAHWTPRPSGLLGPVTLTPLTTR